MASGDTKTESYLRVAAEGARADLPSDTCCNTKTQNLILGVAERIMDVEDEVEELKNNPDVVDIVDTYADLQAYDTQHLTENDIIRVLKDETHNNNSTYYRFTKNPDTWTFIGEVSGGVNVVQTMGTSTTDVMSQNAVSSALFADPTTEQLVQIGHNANAGNYTGSMIGRVAIGLNAKATGDLSNIAIGANVQATTTTTSGRAIGIGGNATKDNTINIGGVQYNSDGKDNVIIGFDASVDGSSRDYCVVIGKGARCSRRAEVNIGTGTYTNKGYNNTAYRILGGVHDPEDAHDAATKGYVDSNVAPTMFYAPFNIYQGQAGNVSIYLDESLTQAATGGDFYDAMAKYGQVILCAPPSYVDSGYHKIVSVSVHQPYEKSVTAFDSYPPEVFFAVLEYPGFVSATLGFNSADPDATAFSYSVNTQ